MAYKTTVNKACATREIALAELWAQLVAMGWTYVDGACTPVTVPYTAVDIAADTFTSVGHTFVNGQPVQLQTTGTAPTGLAVLTQYYVVNVSGNTFKLATTYNGTAINITAQGTGNHTITESYRVYSSNGETGSKIPEYIQFKYGVSATQLTPFAWYFWDVTTHAGYGGQSTYGGILTTSQLGFYIWIYGNKDLVSIWTKVSTTYAKAFFGHFPKQFVNTLTSLTSPATAATPCTLTVASTTGFEVGLTYQIVGAASEGRDPLVVTAINSSTSLTVVSLPRNYSSGSLFGYAPSSFMSVNTSTMSTYFTCPQSITGLSNTGSLCGAIAGLFPIASVDPDYRSNKYALSPIFSTVMDIATVGGSIGFYCDEYFLYPPEAGMTSEDTFAVNKLDPTGYSAGIPLVNTVTSGSSSTLTDSSKSWTVNAWAGKVVVVTFGTGSGMIKKIASNTATQLTLDSGYTFESVPDATSQYIICDEGYRFFTSGSTVSMALREGV